MPPTGQPVFVIVPGICYPGAVPDHNKAKPRMRRERWLALAALPVLLLAGDYFYWRLAVDQLSTSFESWSQRAEASGWVVHHGAIVASGWPDAAALRVRNLSIVVASSPKPAMAWTSGTVLLRIRLTQPETLDVTPIGPHTLRLNFGPPIPITADHIHLRLPLRLNGPRRAIDIEALALTADIPSIGPVKIESLGGQASLMANAARDQPAAGFSMQAHLISMPESLRFGLGAEIEDAALEGVVNGHLPEGQDLTTRLTAWRDEGGSLELHRLAIAWGKAHLEATATLALDEDLQPMGTGTSKIAGHGAALDALAANAVLSKSAARAANAMLSLLADTPGDGQPEAVEAPLTLQFRTLSIGQVPLARLPEFNWPRPSTSERPAASPRAQNGQAQ